MREFFASPMNTGRYPERTAAEVFSSDRRYFDQVLHKNLKFRQAYAAAYAKWARDLPRNEKGEVSLLVERIFLGVEITGQDKTAELFSSLLEFMAGEGETLPAGTRFSDTLPGGKLDVSGGHEQVMRRVRLFWTRLAVQEVLEED